MGFLSRNRKSASSSSSGNTIYNSSAHPSASNSTTSVESLSARIVKTLTFGRQRSSEENHNSNHSSKFPAPTPTAPAHLIPKRRKQPNKVRHPSERELTAANLRHYEMLSEFRMEFGRTRSRSSIDSDVSPMGSRTGSLDFGDRR